LISSLFCAIAGPAAGKSKPKEPAPRFNATTTGGERFNNDSIKGKVVLLEFWTTWCGYCLQEAGFVDRINDAYVSKGLVILAINVGESKKTVKKYLQQHPRTTRIVLTDDTNLAAMFEAKSTRSTSSSTAMATLRESSAAQPAKALSAISLPAAAWKTKTMISSPTPSLCHPRLA
jgi:thiol-disulfide isomerase/thioredoxin